MNTPVVELGANSTRMHPERQARRGRWAPYVAEAIGTFGLVFAGCGAIMVNTLSGGQVTHVGVGQAAALAIGATVGLAAVFAGPISGASMNPARSLGPALMRWTWTDQWVYLLAAPLGAVVGAYTYRWLREAGDVSPSLKHVHTQATQSVTHAEDSE